MLKEILVIHYKTEIENELLSHGFSNKFQGVKNNFLCVDFKKRSFQTWTYNEPSQLTSLEEFHEILKKYRGEIVMSNLNLL